MYELKLSIDVLPKSLNRKLRSHRFANHKENKTFDTLIADLCAGKKPKAPLEKARIEITRHSYRTLDFDGLVGSMKPVVDALVSCGILKDDSWNVTGAWMVDQKFRKKKAGSLLEIRIQETHCYQAETP